MILRVIENHKSIYYLLPGMGAGARKRARRNLACSIIVGILVSGILCGLIYFAYNSF